MPIYSYVCKDCAERFDLLVGVTSNKTELRCKKCGSENIKRTLNSFSVGKAGDKFSSSAPSCPTGSCSTGSCPTCF